MNEILTGLLVIITGFYAWATFHILKANKAVVAIMAKQTESLTRPYIAVTAYLPPDHSIFSLKISNTGKTPAKNLKLSLDREFHKYGRDAANSKFSEFMAFKQPIECFGPGAELFFDLAQGVDIFGEKSEKGFTPSVFSITAEYSYSDKRVSEVNTIDLRPYFMSNLPDDSVVSQSKRIVDAIEKAGDKIKRAIEKA